MLLAALLSTTLAAAVPGASSVGDPLFPGLGNGGYDVQHYTLSLRYPTTRPVQQGRAHVTIDADVALGPRELGDVVISPEHTEDLLEAVVHGVLHLTGMDHETDDGEMLAVQAEIMGWLR